MTRRRKLSPDEVALWQKVTEKTEKLTAQETFDPAAYAPVGKPKTDTAPKADLGRLDGTSPPKPAPRKTRYTLVPSLPAELQKSPVQMDQKAFGKMTRGKMKPEGRIDLHGMTLDRAHAALTKFVLNAHGSGKRLVLVITGKGKNRDAGGPIPVRFGVLRHQVPQWLSTPPLASLVLQVSEAHISHGGGGAYYVYLRRRR
ncbi:Smr/MutS family protein [Roseobacter sp. YSTF-M11]|uniref:Smr/MutS family protein n=1 Tax=Roseobacter insulae TaxID=2859783 RepID=A0A9X1K1N6_9RHOB|nr:Smr/MutS family protein [Roseobacter insulae]MBW4706707.1 Smr/MutS family protein [Roseobacter insulae]